MSDPVEGVWRSANEALASEGLQPISLQQASRMIGPPLEDSMAHLLESDDVVMIERTVNLFRKRYADVGYSENRVYPGIDACLIWLAEHDIPMAICTSKPKGLAEKVVNLFGWSDCFVFVEGGHAGVPKWRQVEDLRIRGLVGGASLMIGDRIHDMEAAARNGMRGVGVLWGHGMPGELTAARPWRLLDSPQQLIELVRDWQAC